MQTSQQRFGIRVLSLRQNRGWSQEQLSEKSGIGVQHISRIENGRKETCLGLMTKLAKSFDISLSELMVDV